MIVVSHDLSARAMRLFRLLDDLGVAAEQRMVVHVADPTHDQSEAATRALLVELLDAQGLGYAEVEVISGEPAAVLAQRARAHDAQSIWVAPRNYRSPRTGMGSVVARLRKQAHCPVVVVHHDTESDPDTAPHEAAPSLEDSPMSQTAQVDAVARQIISLVAERRPMWLASLQVTCPSSDDEAGVRQALATRLADSGVDFVDTSFVVEDGPIRLVEANFEERWSE